MRGSWRPNGTATYWPPLLWPCQRFFPVLQGCSTGAWGPSLSGTCSSFQHLLSNWSDLQLLNRRSSGPPLLCAGFLYRILSPNGLISNWCSPGLYNCSTYTFFLLASQIALIQPVHGQAYILIFLDRMHLLFTQAHFLFWQLGRGRRSVYSRISKTINDIINKKHIKIKIPLWKQEFSQLDVQLVINHILK